MSCLGKLVESEIFDSLIKWVVIQNVIHKCFSSLGNDQNVSS